MLSSGLASMMPTLEKLFRVQKRKLDGTEAEAATAAAGLPGRPVVRIDGQADGKPFVILMVTEN